MTYVLDFFFSESRFLPKELKNKLEEPLKMKISSHIALHSLKAVLMKSLSMLSLHSFTNMSWATAMRRLTAHSLWKSGIKSQIYCGTKILISTCRYFMITFLWHFWRPLYALQLLPFNSIFHELYSSLVCSVAGIYLGIFEWKTKEHNTKSKHVSSSKCLCLEFAPWSTCLFDRLYRTRIPERHHLLSSSPLSRQHVLLFINDLGLLCPFFKTFWHFIVFFYL